MWCFTLKLTAVRFLLACVFLFKGIHGHENGNGALPKPYVKIVDQTENWSLLQCDVRGASPKPEVHWENKAGNILHAEEPKVTERGGRYDIILQTTVNKTDHYHCVAMQKEIGNQIYTSTYVFITGAAPKPSVKIVDETADQSLLQCEVRGASPKPELHWENGAGNILHAEEPKVTETGGRYDIILNITVNKTDIYHCVATQKEISHKIDAETFVFISDKPFEDECSRAAWMIGGWFTGIITAAAAFILFKVAEYIIKRRKMDPPQTNEFYTSTSREPVDFM